MSQISDALDGIEAALNLQNPDAAVAHAKVLAESFFDSLDRIAAALEAIAQILSAE